MYVRRARMVANGVRRGVIGPREYRKDPKPVHQAYQRLKRSDQPDDAPLAKALGEFIKQHKQL